MADVSILRVLLFATVASSAANGTLDSCADVKSFYEAKDKNLAAMISGTSVLGATVNICEGVSTCCSVGVESMLVARSLQDIRIVASNEMVRLADVLSKIHKDLDEFYLNVINDSKVSFHSLFSDVYGDLYTANSDVFMKFFHDLKSYYQGRVIDLADVFEGLFAIVMQRTFKLLSVGYIVDEEYLQCIGDNVHVIRPFGELPSKLSNQVQRSFVAARTLVEALKTGERVVKGMVSVGSGLSALPRTGVIGYTKMIHCSKCAGHVEIKPCRYVCSKTMKECLCGFSESINVPWAQYVKGMVAVLARLKGPFNMEVVLSPINVRMSEAIMMLQENYDRIKDAVTSQCGKLAEDPDAKTPGGPDVSTGSRLNFGMPPEYNRKTDDFDSTGFRDLNIKDLLGGVSSVPAESGEFNLEGLKHLNSDDSGFSFGDNSKSKMNERSANPPKKKSRRRNKRKTRQKKNKHEVNNANARVAIQFAPLSGARVDLENIADDFRSRQKSLKHFWRVLPENICTTAAETNSNNSCWDGAKVTKYTPVLKNDLERGFCSSSSSYQTMGSQVVVLRDMTEKLWLAHRGLDNDFLDQELPADTELSGDGSGADPSLIDLNGQEKSNHHRKIKRIENLDGWQIDLIQLALGRLVDAKSRWKDVKEALWKHPDMQPNGAKQERMKENYGELTPVQQKQLKKILGLHDNDETTGIADKENLVTEPPPHGTTSGAASVAWSQGLVITILFHFSMPY